MTKRIVVTVSKADAAATKAAGKPKPANPAKEFDAKAKPKVDAAVIKNIDEVRGTQAGRRGNQEGLEVGCEERDETGDQAGPGPLGRRRRANLRSRVP